jgi:hypothetical protein
VKTPGAFALAEDLAGALLEVRLILEPLAGNGSRTGRAARLRPSWLPCMNRNGSTTCRMVIRLPLIWNFIG